MAEDAKAMFDGEPSFIDCDDCELMFGGEFGRGRLRAGHLGPGTEPRDDAGGWAGVRGDLRESRPEILGGIIGWAGDRDFVQVMYFIDEQQARAGEQSMASNPRMAAWGQMIEEQPTFLDLRDPTYA